MCLSVLAHTLTDVAVDQELNFSFFPNIFLPSPPPMLDRGFRMQQLECSSRDAVAHGLGPHSHRTVFNMEHSFQGCLSFNRCTIIMAFSLYFNSCQRSATGLVVTSSLIILLLILIHLLAKSSTSSNSLTEEGYLRLCYF